MWRQQRLGLASRYPFLFLLLCALLRTGAFAQETISIAPRPSQNGFTTITIASASSDSSSAISVNSPSTVSAFPSSTSVVPTASATNLTQSTNPPKEGFNYYFIIIAGAAVVFVLFFVFMARRRRIHAIRHANTQRALSEDIAGFRSPRYGRGWGPDPSDANTNTHRLGLRMMGRQRRDEVPEGLNERGEAPPPYKPGSKPPSLRSDDGRVSMESNREMGDVGDMRRPVYRSVPKGEPPEYRHESTGSSSSHFLRREEATVATGPETEDGSVTRPETAVTRP